LGSSKLEQAPLNNAAGFLAKLQAASNKQQAIIIIGPLS